MRPNSSSTWARLGDQQCVVARPRVAVFGKDRSHLGRRLQIEVLPLETKPIGIVLVGPRLDAEQDVMGGRFVPPGVVGVIGGHQRGADFSGNLDQVGHDPLLRLETMILDLDEEVLPTEDVLIMRGSLEGTFEIPGGAALAIFARGVGSQPLGHRPAEATRGGDDSLRVGREKFAVHSRLVVVAVQIGPGGELHQVAVTGLVHREQRHVIANVLAPAGSVEARSIDDISLDADDRIDPCLLGRLVKVDHAVHHSVIGDGDPRLAIGGGRRDDILYPGRSIQHRKFGVQVEVGERHGCNSHRSRVSRPWSPPVLARQDGAMAPFCRAKTGGFRPGPPLLPGPPFPGQLGVFAGA